MASIKKYTGKRGISFQITYSLGFDSTGKRIREQETWYPEPGMSDKQMEKAVNKYVLERELAFEKGYCIDSKTTFAEYADKILQQKEYSGLSPKTLDRYKELLVRINLAIGHMKLIDIRPSHLSLFYQNLAEEGIRIEQSTAVATIDIKEWLKTHKMSQEKLAKKAGISASTVSKAVKKEAIQKAKANAIASAMSKNVSDIFTITANDEPLSAKTVLEHHRLISTIFARASKEMIITYNPAEKVDPPRPRKKDPNYFQPEDVAAIIDALESEPEKWRLIVHLLILTGGRRGEIAGLQWSKIDLQNKTVLIDSSLVHTKSKGVYLSKTKTGDTRRISLPDETIELLRAHKEHQDALRDACGSKWIESDYVFTSRYGGNIHPDSITDWLAKFSKRHNLSHINPHAFRHTAASVLISEGMDINSVARYLGHSTPSTTLNVYSHLIYQKQTASSKMLADTLLRSREEEQK